jgi:tetratricopeptide (TPR) repeat protein
MHQYGVKDVEKLLRLPRSTLRSLIAAGFVAPSRGPRNTLLFSFQDLIVLRTAQALADAKIPAKRITRSLKELRRQLPDEMPLSGLSIGAVGERVVVKDGAGQRQVESGQYLLAFEGDPAQGALSVIERPASPVAPAVAESQPDWFARAASLETRDAEAAIEAYERAIAAAPEHLDAHLNLGRLLHERGELARAEKVYRGAPALAGSSALLHFNLGVLLEDLQRRAEAVAEYEQALRADPALADAHYNLALLCEQQQRPREAIRHMAQYRRLLGEV